MGFDSRMWCGPALKVEGLKGTAWDVFGDDESLLPFDSHEAPENVVFFVPNIETGYGADEDLSRYSAFAHEIGERRPADEISKFALEFSEQIDRLTAAGVATRVEVVWGVFAHTA